MRDPNEHRLKLHENRRKGHMVKSHKELREAKHPSMDFLECKKTESVADSNSESEMSEVLMSHQDFLSRNVFDEIEEKNDEDLDDFEGIHNNIYVGKTELLPRESHF